MFIGAGDLHVLAVVVADALRCYPLFEHTQSLTTYMSCDTPYTGPV
jgi:hypothetical protein